MTHKKQRNIIKHYCLCIKTTGKYFKNDKALCNSAYLLCLLICIDYENIHIYHFVFIDFFFPQ